MRVVWSLHKVAMPIHPKWQLQLEETPFLIIAAHMIFKQTMPRH